MSKQRSLYPIKTIVICDDGSYYSGDTGIAYTLVASYIKNGKLDVSDASMAQQFGCHVQFALHQNNKPDQPVTPNEVEKRWAAHSQTKPGCINPLLFSYANLNDTWNLLILGMNRVINEDPYAFDDEEIADLNEQMKQICDADLLYNFQVFEKNDGGTFSILGLRLRKEDIRSEWSQEFDDFHEDKMAVTFCSEKRSSSTKASKKLPSKLTFS